MVRYNVDDDTRRARREGVRLLDGGAQRTQSGRRIGDTKHIADIGIVQVLIGIDIERDDIRTARKKCYAREEARWKQLGENLSHRRPP